MVALAKSILQNRLITRRGQAFRRWRRPVACSAVSPAVCHLVGAGPGSKDYLTLKAVELIQAADVIVHDDLGTQESLAFARPGCKLVPVGKRGGLPSIKQPEINRLLVEECLAPPGGRRVVRLKGGCPSLFSRASSEMAALAAAGVPYQLIPGVSSALAAPLLAGFPLTDVALSPSVAIVSGHDVEGTDWAAFRGIATLIILMAGKTLGDIAQRLIAIGWQSDTPVAVIKAAGTPKQQQWQTRLSEAGALAQQHALSPSIVVIGRITTS